MKVSKELKQELGNALAAYGEVLFCAMLGTKVPSRFEALNTLSKDELIDKIQLLRNFYDSLEEEN